MSEYRNNRGSYQRPSFYGGFSYFPPVLKALLISNAAIFLGMGFISAFRIGDFPVGALIQQEFSLWPLNEGFWPWQLFTYMFMHASFSHLFFNMIALWMFGMELENSLGSKRFLTFYLLCGLGGGLLHLLAAPLFSVAGPTVGASGAVYGVLLAFGLLFPERLIMIYFFVPIKAKYFVLLYMVIEFLSVGSLDGIAHFAHIGGAVVGFVFLLVEGFQFSLFTGSQQSIFKSQKQNQQKEEVYTNISDAKVANEVAENETTQAEIDEILDKISNSGYQNLSTEEKKILFEASKKLH
ncbi:MAG: rhomboid family intramembrane serine protease [Ignavibacteria bacterium]|nr:rhomboid family intramembrane serine protease [Bacteroidota bacterium]MSQ46581.1 rhomboid family intramembrane serine protease [Ignavibacteria bacterium]